MSLKEKSIDAEINRDVQWAYSFEFNDPELMIQAMMSKYASDYIKATKDTDLVLIKYYFERMDHWDQVLKRYRKLENNNKKKLDKKKAI